MEDSGNRLPARQDFPHLSDAHWAGLEKMVNSWARQPSLDFPTFLLSSKGRAWSASTTEAQSAAQASATNTASFAARPTTTKPVKTSVPTFDGKDSDSLVFWVREIEIALSAGQISDARAQVAFALSNLGGRARAWAMARETATPGYFTSWSFMEQELRSTFLLANVAYRHRSNFLRCKQGQRSLQDYVMELHNLEAAMAGAPLSEDVKVTAIMDDVRTGPVRTELFRRQPKTFNEVVHIVMLEDHCVRSAQHHTPHVEASEGPTPMEVSLAESTRPQRTPRAGDRCFGCNQPGHFRRNCPTNPWKVSPSSTSPKEQVPETTLLCLSVAAARSNLMVVTACVKGYPEPMTVLIDSGASFNFATKASVARNNAVYASALEASKSNTNGSAVCNRVAFVQGTVTTQGADAAAARGGRGGSVRAPLRKAWWLVQPTSRKALGLLLATNKSGRVETPTTQGVVAGSARATEGAGACARATTGGRAGAPTSKATRGDKVTSTPKAEATDRDADSAAEDRAPQVLDVFTGEPNVGEVLTPLPTVAELLELEELSYVEFLDSLKAGELAEVVLLRSEDGSLELNSSSVMDSDVLEDERTNL
ncbi:unnamed protein product [Phytophthora fragariaefolia]|uniref:Unnamed protein product n=1 Tax=Phytophthora fragariaefolia TaxID=1490495 RepID=A0A9W6XUS1_9STRA|nr:unnamed protein product [Phytophthora fragariaefolia]